MQKYRQDKQTDRQADTDRQTGTHATVRSWQPVASVSGPQWSGQGGRGVRPEPGSDLNTHPDVLA